MKDDVKKLRDSVAELVKRLDAIEVAEAALVAEGVMPESEAAPVGVEVCGCDEAVHLRRVVVAIRQALGSHDTGDPAADVRRLVAEVGGRAGVVTMAARANESVHHAEALAEALGVVPTALLRAANPWQMLMAGAQNVRARMDAVEAENVALQTALTDARATVDAVRRLVGA